MKVDVYKSKTSSWTYLIVPAGSDLKNINPEPEVCAVVHLIWKDYETVNTILDTEYVHGQLENHGYFIFR